MTRRCSRGQGQADLPAEQPASGQGSRFSAAHAHPCRPGHRLLPPPQRPRFSDCLTSRSRAVLPARNRMRRSTDFSLAVRNGVRVAQSDLVLHARHAGVSADGVAQIGLIITKSVGGSVERHRVARRLRHVARTVMSELNPTDRIVIRALPSSRDAASSRLEEQVRAGVRRAHNLMERNR
jgi:ribonuclease P protein component